MHMPQRADRVFNQIRHNYRGRKIEGGTEERRGEEESRRRDRERMRERGRESTEGYIGSKLVCMLQCVRDRGRERRQDGVLAQMKTVPGYVFVDGCVNVSVCVHMCLHVHVSVCKKVESDGVCKQHALSHLNAGTQAMN